MLSALLMIGLQLGAIERLPGGIDDCQRYITATPELRMAWVNGHRARNISNDTYGWVADKEDAQRWCRHGVNRIRLDTWAEPNQNNQEDTP